MENEIPNTQFGFRKDHSTEHAIHCARRIQDYVERAGSQLLLVLLDGEKAFDKVTHLALDKSLRGLDIPENLVQLTMALYANPTLQVVNGRSHVLEKKKKQKQSTGIR